MSKGDQQISFSLVFAFLTCLYKYPPPGQGSAFRGAIKAFIKIKMYVTSSGFPPALHTAGQLTRARVGVKFPLFYSLTSSWSLIDCDGLFYALHVLVSQLSLRFVISLLSMVFQWPLLLLLCLSVQNLTWKHLLGCPLQILLLNNSFSTELLFLPCFIYRLGPALAYVKA